MCHRSVEDPFSGVRSNQRIEGTRCPSLIGNLLRCTCGSLAVRVPSLTCTSHRAHLTGQDVRGHL